MKRIRFAMLVILPLCLLVIQGCTPKSYTYIFTEELDLNRIDGNWYANNEDYLIGRLGLALHNCRVSAPHYYTGDFDVTVTYKANSEAISKNSLSVSLSTNRERAGADWFGVISIYRANADDAFIESGYNDSDTGFVSIDDSLLLGDMANPDGINVLKLIKKGSTLKFELNGNKIGSIMEIIGNSTDFYIPQLYSGGYDGEVPLIIKSIEVKYSGDQFLII